MLIRHDGSLLALVHQAQKKIMHDEGVLGTCSPRNVSVLLIALQRQCLGKTYYDSHTAACTLCGAFLNIYFMIFNQPAEIHVTHERAGTDALCLAQTLVQQLPDLPDSLWRPR